MKRVVHNGDFIRDWLDRLAYIAVSSEYSFKTEFNLLRTQAAAELAYSSGLLPVHVQNLRYSAIDFDRPALKLEDRLVPITPVAVQAIETWRARTRKLWGKDHEYLFFGSDGRDKPITIPSHDRGFRDAGDAVGFRLSASDIRAAFVVEMKERGMSVEQLAYITGLPAKALATWERR